MSVFLLWPKTFLFRERMLFFYTFGEMMLRPDKTCKLCSSYTLNQSCHAYIHTLALGCNSSAKQEFNKKNTMKLPCFVALNSVHPDCNLNWTESKVKAVISCFMPNLSQQPGKKFVFSTYFINQTCVFHCSLWCTGEGMGNVLFPVCVMYGDTFEKQTSVTLSQSRMTRYTDTHLQASGFKEKE